MMKNRIIFFLAAALAQMALGATAAEFVEVNGVVSMEAESFSTQTGYSRHANAEASELAVMKADGADGSSLNFPFTVQQAGTWYVWTRTYSTADINNGYRLGLDQTVLGDIYLKKIGWTWRPEWLTGDSHSGPVTLNLSAGSHILKIIKRKIENPLVDKIVLTRSSEAPTGLGPATTKAGSATSLAIRPASLALHFGAANGRTLTVTADTAWTATANRTWITIASGKAGSGNGTITFNVAANVGAVRTGTITVKGGGLTRVFSIKQIAPVLALNPATLSLPFAAANSRSITVTGNTAWTATAHPSWLTIISGKTGAGNGTVIFNVALNAGAARTGTITVKGGGLTRVFTIKQIAAVLVLNPENLYIPSRGVTSQQLSITANFPWTATISAPWISVTSFMSGSPTVKVRFNVLPNTTAHARKATATISGSGITRIFTVYQWPAATHPLVAADGDFDGDFKADVATFQPTTGKWDALLTAGHRWIMPFGSEVMLPVPADYDGDGMVDFALFQKYTGEWYLLYSSGGSRKVQFGWHKTVPVPGDYDGDGRADLALYYPDQYRWYFLCTTEGGSSVQFGGAADIPVPADYDGDGATDIAVYRPSNGMWYIVYSGGGSQITPFGGASMIPVPGDYDSDGRADIAVLHRETSTWNILYSDGGSLSLPFGYKTMTPVAADYDGDGATDIAMYHPTSGTWYIRQSTTLSVRKVAHGGPDRIPVLLTPMVHSWFDLP